MQNSLRLSAKPLRMPCGALKRSMLASLFLLSVLPGCGSTALKPVSTKPVPKYLLSSLKAPDCRPKERAGVVRPEALGKSNLCWEAAYSTADRRLKGLQSAVRTREAAIKKAQETAKEGPSLVPTFNIF